MICYTTPQSARQANPQDRLTGFFLFVDRPAALSGEVYHHGQSENDFYKRHATRNDKKRTFGIGIKVGSVTIIWE